MLKLPALLWPALAVAVAAPAQAVTSWPSPEDRGLTPAAALLHLHSPYSHDACDDEGLNEAGEPNPECLARMRAAMCDTRRDLYLLTDHPAHMSEHSFVEDLLYDPALGDRLVVDAQGRPVANEILCIDGALAWSAWIMVGWENSHAMPVALDEHAPAGVPSVGYGTGTPLADQQAAIAAVHEVGGLAMLAHAEEEDVTAQRILEEGLDALELYNAHANINVILYRHPLQLLDLEDWVWGADDAPVSDYVALLAYKYMDLRPLEKWDEVLATRMMPGGIGTDVHENVILDAYCAMAPIDRLCGVLARWYPNLVAWLTEGGPIPMADGDRLDSYDRMFRWFSNHLLVQTRDVAELEAALRAGRSYVAFDILANPQGFDFAATDGSGRLTEMGGALPFAPDVELLVAAPRPAAVDVRGDSWSEAQLQRARIIGHVLRITADGVEEIARLGPRDDALRIPVPGPGTYRVEFEIQPLHLTAVLGSQPQLAGRIYPWVWSNPIHVE